MAAPTRPIDSAADAQPAASTASTKTLVSHWIRPPGSIKALDGVRAIAILLVIGRHGVRPFWNEDAGGLAKIGGWELGTPLHNGWMGVDLFFVLSGFLITLHIVRRYGIGFGLSHIGDYARRRAFRIVPAYVASMLIAISGLVPFFRVPGENLGWRLLYHFAFLQDYLPSNIVVVYWSLGVEEKFYLTAPFMLMGILRLSARKSRYIGVVVIAVLPTLLRLVKYWLSGGVDDYGQFFEQVRSPFHLTFDGLVLGVLAALVYIDRDELPWTRNRLITSTLTWVGIMTFAGLLFGQPMMSDISGFNQTLMQTIIAFASAALIGGLVLGGGPTRLLEGKVLFVIGKLSYAWYLMHLMVIPLCVQVAAAMSDVRFTQIVVFVPLYLATSLTLAWLLHAGVERPFLARR